MALQPFEVDHKLRIRTFAAIAKTLKLLKSETRIKR